MAPLNLRGIDEAIAAKLAAHEGPVRQAALVAEVFADIQRTSRLTDPYAWWGLRLKIARRVKVFFQRMEAAEIRQNVHTPRVRVRQGGSR